MSDDLSHHEKGELSLWLCHTKAASQHTLQLLWDSHPSILCNCCFTPASHSPTLFVPSCHFDTTDVPCPYSNLLVCFLPPKSMYRSAYMMSCQTTTVIALSQDSCSFPAQFGQSHRFSLFDTYCRRSIWLRVILSHSSVDDQNTSEWERPW